MPWQVGIVVDDRLNLGALLGWLPVWAWATDERCAQIDELRADWGALWEPEPSLTLINTPIGKEPVEAVLGQIQTIELHHPQMAAIRIFGLPDSDGLRKGMSIFGYNFASASSEWGVYARPMADLDDVQELEMDAAGWTSSDAVYDSFFKAVGAPDWHGRSLDALNDSIATGGINKAEVPYRLVVRNASKAGAEARKMIDRFAELIQDIQTDGCPVSMTVLQ